MHSPFFGTEIQPKHLVFFYLGFRPGFPWFSAFFPTLCTVISEKTKLSCFGGFFPWFFKSKQLPGFLGVVFMLEQGPNRNITFLIKYY
jgi:hypothetical protein